MGDRWGGGGGGWKWIFGRDGKGRGRKEIVVIFLVVSVLVCSIKFQAYLKVFASDKNVCVVHHDLSV